MYNILTLNKIAACGLDRLGDNYNRRTAPSSAKRHSAHGIFLRNIFKGDI